MTSRTKKSDIPGPRQPLLTIAGVPGGLARRLSVLDEHHPLYGVAALVLLHGDHLDADVLRPLYGALLTGWPRKQGDRPDEYRAHLAALLSQMGATAADIADAWDVDISTARKRIRRGLRRRELYDPTAPNTLAPFTLEILIAPEDVDRIARQDNTVLPEPLDPGSDVVSSRAQLAARVGWGARR